MPDINQLLRQGYVLLKQKGQIDAHLEAQILLGHVLSRSRAYLLAHSEQEISAPQEELYQTYLKQRAQGLPIAYITGEREFWSLSLKVNQHTLIPRHETELIVEVVLDLFPEKKPLNLLDLGTGSGALALALAHERPLWQISACDFSKEALVIAQENAQRLNLTSIQFYHSHWFANLPQQSYDLIVANPPYIASEDPHLQEGDVRFEPLSALVSSQDGLADLQYIISHSVTFLNPGGMLLLEHGYNQKDSVHTLLKQSGYKKINSWQDLSSQDRVSGGYVELSNNKVC